MVNGNGQTENETKSSLSPDLLRIKFFGSHNDCVTVKLALSADSDNVSDE